MQPRRRTARQATSEAAQARFGDIAIRHPSAHSWHTASARPSSADASCWNTKVRFSSGCVPIPDRVPTGRREAHPGVPRGLPWHAASIASVAIERQRSPEGRQLRSVLLNGTPLPRPPGAGAPPFGVAAFCKVLQHAATRGWMNRRSAAPKPRDQDANLHLDPPRPRQSADRLAGRARRCRQRAGTTPRPPSRSSRQHQSRSAPALPRTASGVGHRRSWKSVGARQ